MAHFTIRAEEEIEAATLVLDPSSLEGITLDWLVPLAGRRSPPQREDRVDLGRVRAGTEHMFSSTSRSTRPSRPALAGRRALRPRNALLEVDRTVTIFP